MMYGVWKVISKQTWLDNQKHFFNILMNWWNKIYGKQHDENGTNSTILGLIESTCIMAEVKVTFAKPCCWQHYRDTSVVYQLF